MSGRIKEACVYSLSDDYDPNQATLDSWGDLMETKIAVVSRPSDKMLEVTDECFSELGMPEKYLSRFWKRRSDYQLNSAIDNPHNRAYEDLSLDTKYIEHIRNSAEAQRALTELVSRIENGECITLVCFEEGHEHCHRHVLLDIIEKRIENNFIATERATPVE